MTGRLQPRPAWDDALGRLAQTVGRGGGSDRFVTSVLESVADLAEARQAPAPLPAGERELWESAGASFATPALLARSRARAAVGFADLLERSLKGDLAVAALLEVDRSRVSQRLSEGSLYSVVGHDDRYFPIWQFDGNKVLRGLRTVLSALDDGTHPLTVDAWFTRPNLDLEVAGEPVSPVRWLATGGAADAVALLAADL